MPDRPGRPKHVRRLCWEHLTEDPIRSIFNSYLQQSFTHNPVEAGDTESGGTTFCNFIVKVSALSFGCKVVGASHGTYW